MTENAMEDQLQYVRDRLKIVGAAKYDEISANTDVSRRTIFHIRRPDSKPLYETINKLYVYLKANDGKPATRKPRAK